MSDDDVLIQVKSKEGPIENSKKVPLGRGTTADILIDVFEFEYGKKQFICIRSHASRGCTVKVKELREYSNGPKYFDFTISQWMQVIVLLSSKEYLSLKIILSLPSFAFVFGIYGDRSRRSSGFSDFLAIWVNPTNRTDSIDHSIAQLSDTNRHGFGSV